MGHKFTDELLLDGLARDKYYTVSEMAEISGIPAPTIYRRLKGLVNRGKLIEGNPRSNNTGEGGRPNRTFTPRNARRGPLFEESGAIRYADRVWTVEEYEHLTATTHGRILGVLIALEGSGYSEEVWRNSLPRIKDAIRKHINVERQSITRWEAILYSPELNPENSYDIADHRGRISLWANSLEANGSLPNGCEGEWDRLDSSNL